MYAQLTTRCNMRCEHCMFACSAVGEDMARDVWEAALRITWDAHGYITLGGGEPTLHPHFRDYLAQALDARNNLGERLRVQVITNGTNEDVCMEMLDMYRRMRADAHGTWLRFRVAISVDEWHDRDMQSDAVLRAYANEGLIHTLDGLAVAEGRAVGLPERSRRVANYSPDTDFAVRLRVAPSGVLTHYCEPSRSKSLGDARAVYVERALDSTVLLDERGGELLRWWGAAWRWRPSATDGPRWTASRSTLDLMRLVQMSNYEMAMEKERVLFGAAS